MKTVKLSVVAVAAVTLIAGAAFAEGKKHDGRWARSKVMSYNQKRGLSTAIRVHEVRSSTSRKSSQVAVANLNSGQVKLLNVAKRTGKVSATATPKLTRPGTARGLANLGLHREAGVQSNKKQPGSFSGVNSSGLSASGKSYKINSATDRNETIYVGIKGGKVKRFDK